MRVGQPASVRPSLRSRTLDAAMERSPAVRAAREKLKGAFTSSSPHLLTCSPPHLLISSRPHLLTPSYLLTSYAPMPD